MAAILYYYSALKAKFEDRERGATAVEYGIMVAAIAVVIIAAVFTIGTELNTDFNTVKDKLAGTGGSTAG